MSETELVEEIHKLEEKLRLLDKAYSVFPTDEIPESLRKEKFETEKSILQLRKSLLSLSDNVSEAVSVTPDGDAVFVIMPFKEPFNEYYEKIIKPAISELNHRVIRSDEIYSPSSFLQTIWNSIINSKLVIAELTNVNPNVLYELGLCHAINKTVIIMAQSMEDIPADLRHINCIIYDTRRADWTKELTTNIQKMVLYVDKHSNRPSYLTPAATVENTLFIDSITQSRDRFHQEVNDLKRENASYKRTVSELRSRKTELEEITASVARNATQDAIVSASADSNITTYTVPIGNTGVTIELVKVESGGFIHGAGDNQKEVLLDTFYISRFSITNAQYAVFLNHVGNRSDDGASWINLSGVSPCDKCRIYVERREFKVEDGYEDFPVTYVNYYGADAFCHWAGGELPTEEQWEKAVRGTDGRNYPWGNEPPNPGLANCSEDGWARDVSPIEVYKLTKGASPFGVIQGIGNVWHWTRTYYSEKNSQAVRGGSFFDFRIGHRTVYRFVVQPNGPDFSQGFLFSKRFLSLDNSVS